MRSSADCDLYSPYRLHAERNVKQFMYGMLIKIDIFVSSKSIVDNNIGRKYKSCNVMYTRVRSVIFLFEYCGTV